jgi:hypothetical protein
MVRKEVAPTNTRGSPRASAKKFWSPDANDLETNVFGGDAISQI